MKKMTPKEKGQFLLEHFKNERGDLDLAYVDLSDFSGDVVISNWKVGGSLFQDHQEVKRSLYQCNQKARCNIYQYEQKAEGLIRQDEQEATKDTCPDMCVEPDYKAEYERLRKELYEADRKIETLMWALGKAMEADK